LAIIIYK